MPLSHSVHAFGLSIASEIPLPELPSGTAPPDVKIRLGDVPDDLGPKAIRGVCYHATPETFLFRMTGVAGYYVEQGRQITVCPEPGADSESVRLFLLGPVLASVACHRELLPLTASGVRIRGQGVLFIGFSGVGRSSLAAQFTARDHALLCDDLCFVDLRANEPPLVRPSYPRLKLYPNAIEATGYSLEQAAPLRPGLEKRSLSVPDRFADKPVPLGRIYRLRGSSNKEMNLTSLEGARKLGTLMEYALNAHFIRKTYGEAACFSWCTQVIQHVEVRGLSYSRRTHTVEDMVRFLEADLAS